MLGRIKDFFKPPQWSNIDAPEPDLSGLRLYIPHESMLQYEASGLDFDVYSSNESGVRLCVKKSKGDFIRSPREIQNFYSILEKLRQLNLPFVMPFVAEIEYEKAFKDRVEPSRVVIAMPWLEVVPQNMIQQLTQMTAGEFGHRCNMELEPYGLALKDTPQLGLFEGKPYLYDLSSIVWVKQSL